jgi:hypothetical protein
MGRSPDIDLNEGSSRPALADLPALHDFSDEIGVPNPDERQESTISCLGSGGRYGMMLEFPEARH